MGAPLDAGSSGGGGGNNWGTLAGAGMSNIGNVMNLVAQGKRDHDARNFALMQGDIEWDRQLQGWNLQNARDDMQWNRQNSYNEYLWNKQNDYNLQMWNMQNAYDSPAAQMQRYKEAGLNPNLIYGQSNTGGSVSTANLESSPYHSGSAPHGGRPSNWSPGRVDLDLSGGIAAYMNMKEQAARTSNLEAQNKVQQQQALLLATQNAKTATEGSILGLDLQKRGAEAPYYSQLAKTSADAAEQNLNNLRQEYDLASNRDKREDARNTREGKYNAQQIQESNARIENLRSSKALSDKEGVLKDMLIEMQRLGIQPNDNVLFRILGKAYYWLKNEAGKGVRTQLNDDGTETYYFDR